MEASSFAYVKSVDIPGLSAKANLYKHNVHGCEYMNIQCDDTNNVFCIAFRTFPESDMGTAHALEHMVLHGSKKYPITDVFYEIDKRSINTFLNAMTSIEWTAYPLASMNETDFHNLMDVYLDSVFQPNLLKDHFQFEVHHTEFSTPDDPSSPLTEVGVVYNEMEGSYSTPDEIFDDEKIRHSIPDTSMKASDGGYPSEIAKLTVEDIADLHRKYYKPSNCIIFHYGSFDTTKVMEHVDRFLREIEPQARYISPTLKVHQPLYHHNRVEITGPLEIGEKPDAQIRASISWLIGEMTDVNLNFDFRILEDLLTSDGSSPLFLALLKSGIASSWCEKGLSRSHLPLVFSVAAKGISEANLPQFFSQTESTLKSIVADGFTPLQVSAAINKAEIKMREVSKHAGIRFLDKFITQWLEGSDPTELVDPCGCLKALREKLSANPRYFESLIDKYLIKNDSRSDLVSRPDADFFEKRDAPFKAAMKAKREAMTEAEVRETLALPSKLHAVVEAKKPVELLPSIKVKDLNQIQPQIPHYIAKGIYVFPQHLNDLIYISVSARLPKLNDFLSKAAIFANEICCLGGEGLSDVEFAAKEGQFTNGFKGTAKVAPNQESPELPSALIQVRYHCLSENFEQSLKLLHIILFDPDFTNEIKIKSVADIVLNKFLLKLSRRGLKNTKDFASRGANRASALREILEGGISTIRAAKEVLKDISAERKKMEKFFKDEFSRAKFEICIHCDEKNVTTCVEKLKDLKDELSERSGIFEETADYSFADSYIDEARKQEHILVEYSTKTNFTAVSFAAPFHKEKNAAHYEVASGLLDNDYLICAIRQKLGAYGAYSRADSFYGSGSLFTFRDSCPNEVLKAFRTVIDQSSSGDFDDNGVERAILHAVANIDHPIAPGKRGMEYFYGAATYEQLQALRSAVISTKKGDVVKALKEIGSQKWRVSIIGNHTNFEVPQGFKVETL